MEMAKAAKKTGKGKKSAQVEAGRLEESGGTDTERMDNAPAVTEAKMQEA